MPENGDLSAPSHPPSAAPARSMSPQSGLATEQKASLKRRAQAGPENKITKRRAARACSSCRARKVRCDVVEHSPCGNCRWDNVECIVEESRRRKKNVGYHGPSTVGSRAAGRTEALRPGISAAVPISTTANATKPVPALGYLDQAASGAFSVPPEGQATVQPMCQPAGGGYTTAGSELSSAVLSALGTLSSGIPITVPLATGQGNPLVGSLSEQAIRLPPFIKPIPDRIALEDRQFLLQKGAFTLPNLRLQNALLRAYVEYVHPYMPVMELHEFLNAINHRDGASGQVSLILYQAVMFVATAFVDEGILKDAGYPSRKDARKTLFARTRLLYDFDYETDRLVLVQALLLMTYWYETPDDQKDTWHWMGVAISLAHTIGLHRDPANTIMAPRKQKLWKRVWWSCFMRDRLIALGMRRPTRIKIEDFDVPMLTESDLEIEALPEDNQLLGPDCALIRDVEMQRQLAAMCVEKAMLCVLIGHMLKAQYSVLSRENISAENTTNSTMMLFPNKNPNNAEDVQKVDRELAAWFQNLPECCRHQPLDSLTITEGNKPLAVQRNLLHMVYHTTVSALHRPLFLPASPANARSIPPQVQETARQRVRHAAEHITIMADELNRYGLEQYLPTTGVTVILPAMIIHLVDMKSPNLEARARATQGFKVCYNVMGNLRSTYAAADFATGFLDAALRKAALVNPAEAAPVVPEVLNRSPMPTVSMPAQMPERASTPPPEDAPSLHLTDDNPFQAGQPFLLPAKDSGADLDMLAGNTPPRTDPESETTHVVGGGLEYTATGTGAGAGSFPGNAFDFDQWLQFPAEGVNTSDDTFMDMFGDHAAAAADSGGLSMDWMGSMQQ
ncbi:hypothetical protein VTK56DRAFT_664 [Thermocarpiscus australiensis]